jgi:hypothetical protein
MNSGDVRADVWVVVGPDSPVEHEIEVDTGYVHVTFGGRDGVDVVFAPAALARLAELGRALVSGSDSSAGEVGR